MATALEIVTLERMKTELRIPLTITDHDSIIEGQINSAVNFVSEYTGRKLVDPDRDNIVIPAALEMAIIALVRDLYTGTRDLRSYSIINAMIDPFIVVT